MPNVEAQKSPTAQGTFSKTPWPHLLVYALERRLTGSFVLRHLDELAAVVVMAEGFPAKVRLHGAWTTTSTEDEPIAGLARLYELPADGTYAYFADDDALEDVEARPTDPLGSIWQGVQRHPAWDHVDATLTKLAGRAVRLSKKAQLERFGFGAAEARVLASLEGPCRVLDLEAERMMPPRAAELLVYCLVITRQVDLVEQDLASPPSTGQAFARVQLQAKSVSRSPLVIEEAPVTRSASDARISSPVPAPIPLPKDTPPPTIAGLPTEGTASIPPVTPPNTTQLAGDLNPEQLSLKGKILERAKAISSQDYFQMLGVGRDADTDAVQKAFVTLAKVWHPDRLPPALASVKDECGKVFFHLTEAHATLSDPAQRKSYMLLMKDGGATPDDQAKIQSIIEAATAFQKAEIFLKRNDMTQAYEHAQLARRLDGEQSDYLALVTWLEALRPDCATKEKTLEKIALLDQCVQKSPNSERAVFWRGMLHKRIDDAASAVRDFKRASELNPRNLDAVREVRVHNMRSAKPSTAPPSKPTNKPSPQGGILGKLFKK